MTGGIQSTVNTVQAPGVEGDFCSANPRWTVIAAQYGLVAGASGVTVGRFAWAVPPADNDGSPTIVNNFGFGPVTGFVHRAQQGLNTTYLSNASMTVPVGFPITLFNGGEFFVKNAGATEAQYLQKAYANYADGRVTFAATGSPTSGGSGSASSVGASTFSVTGSIANGILNVTAVGSGSVVPGATISGTGVATGTQIVAQLTGAANGIGTYQVSVPEQVVTSTTISGTYGTLTVGGTVVAGFAVNQLINGTNVVAGTYITALGTGTGGAGTYIVNNNTVVSSTAITSYVNVETKFFAGSTGLSGELVKISSHVQG